MEAAEAKRPKKAIISPEEAAAFCREVNKMEETPEFRAKKRVRQQRYRARLRGQTQVSTPALRPPDLSLPAGWCVTAPRVGVTSPPCRRRKKPSSPCSKSWRS
jgi:hypothetical protein